MNNFTAIIVKNFKNWSNFGGRSTRTEYFYFLLSAWIFMFMATIAAPDSNFGSLVYLVYIVPMTAAAVRRMHDSGMSGWWIMFPFANIFLIFRKSESGLNKYGPPVPPRI